MSEMVSLPVNEIPEPERRSLESLIGSPLRADQQVFVMVFSAGKVADDATKQAAMASIRRTFEKIDRHQATNAISDEQTEAAIEEAMEHVRPRPS